MAAALTTFATNAIIAFCRRETVLPAASVTRNRMLHAFNDYAKLYRPFCGLGAAVGLLCVSVTMTVTVKVIILRRY